MKFNLGCGDDYRPDWVNVDIHDDLQHSPDILYDIEEVPWPWEDDSAGVILMDNVLEHLHPSHRPAVIDECHRVLREGGKLIVRLPTRTGWDITHFAVPSPFWPRHPRHRDDWQIQSISTTPIGIGSVLPEEVRLQCLKWDLVRVASETEAILIATN